MGIYADLFNFLCRVLLQKNKRENTYNKFPNNNGSDNCYFYTHDFDT